MKKTGIVARVLLRLCQDCVALVNLISRKANLFLQLSHPLCERQRLFDSLEADNKVTNGSASRFLTLPQPATPTVSFIYLIWIDGPGWEMLPSRLRASHGRFSTKHLYGREF